MKFYNFYNKHHLSNPYLKFVSFIRWLNKMQHVDADGEDGPLNGPVVASGSNSYGSYGSIPAIAQNDSRIHSSDSEEDHEGSAYTELLRGSVPCPTCRGVGNIPKGL